MTLPEKTGVVSWNVVGPGLHSVDVDVDVGVDVGDGDSPEAGGRPAVGLDGAADEHARRAKRSHAPAPA